MFVFFYFIQYFLVDMVTFPLGKMSGMKQVTSTKYLLTDSGCFQPDASSWEGGPAVCRVSRVACRVSRVVCGVAELSGFVKRIY